MRILLALVLFLAGCQMAPTKVSEVHYREFELLVDKAGRPLVLTEETIVLDARSAFDYGLNHVRGALHFPWQNLAAEDQSGDVMPDLRKAALRLSLLGLQPRIPVVIVGYGLKGSGKEGRLAWNLLYLGFQDVQVASNDLFRKEWTPNPSPQRENAPVWTVNPRDEMRLSKDDFMRLALDAKGRLENKIFIIDVRSAGEYARKSKALPDFGALHMDWKEFYTRQGRPNAEARSKLERLRISPRDRVILISNKGVRSGAVAYALTALGFTSVQNFTGGWKALDSSKRP